MKGGETMEGETQTQEQVPQSAPVESGAGNNPEETGLVDSAHSVAERLGKQLDEYKQLLNRQEQLYAKQLLAGRSRAGEVVKVKTEDDVAQEEADKFLERFYGKKK